MTFARIVFVAAGIWGVAVLTPLLWLVDVTGRRYAPPTTSPQFFYGFFIVALAWQLAFLVIGSNPARFRPLMIPAMVEKLGYVATLAVLYGQERIAWSHSALTTLVENGEEVKILRDNMPFGQPGKGEFGTFFIGYARSPAPVEQMLENMFVGRPPGNYDRLLDFSEAVSGNLFFVPSASLLEALAERRPDAAGAGCGPSGSTGLAGP